MNLRCLTAVALIARFLSSAALAGDKPREEIKFPSPDGKFALRLFSDYAKGRAETEIVRLPGHKVVLELDDMGQPFIWEKTLVWSADSQRVAYFRPDNRGGRTTVYFRKGNSFQEIELPELPAPEFSGGRSENVDIVGHLVQPVRWLESGSLLLYSELEDEVDQSAAAEITIGFDKNNKPSVLGTTKKAVREK